MPTFTTKDGTQIYYKDWGEGQPIVFSHGWPLSSDAWEDQMFFLAERGFRCIAHDRRGHGRSSQPWNGNDLDTYADDLAQLVDKLGLQDAILVGHSTGGGEVARYVARQGKDRAAMLVLIDSIPPQLVQSKNNPEGVPMEVFDDMRKALLTERSQFFKDLTTTFYGANRGTKVTQGLRDQFWRLGMQAGFKAVYDCTRVWESDQFDDLKKIEVPTLIIHGDEDQVVPIKVGGDRQAKLLKNNTYHVIKGAPHGLPSTHKDEVNKTLLEFIQAHGGKATRPGATGERAGRRAPPAYGA